jgi:hypothetical protein
LEKKDIDQLKTLENTKNSFIKKKNNKSLADIDNKQKLLLDKISNISKTVKNAQKNVETEWK